jgi:hypothetical protein
LRYVQSFHRRKSDTAGVAGGLTRSPPQGAHAPDARKRALPLPSAKVAAPGSQMAFACLITAARRSLRAPAARLWHGAGLQRVHVRSLQL